MRIDWIESAVREAVTNESSSRYDAIEALIDALLSGLLGFPSRATDGFAALREEITPTSYFAVGKVYMIEDQSSHPVWLDLFFSDEGIGPGTVHFGVRSARGVSTLDHKLENALLASPRETTVAVKWSHEFRRHPGAWVLADAT